MDVSIARSRRRTIMLLGIVAACIALGGVYACSGGGFGQRRLVEVFDNGPGGGPGGPSEGYMWVGKNDHQPPGKSWAPVDADSLTAEQKKRIR